MEARPNLVAIVGPTASGKTSLALNIAERYNGEIICADSRTIYTYMDIGTAKPTADEQSRVRHWGLDLVGPGDKFSAADFQRYAQSAIADIQSRGKLPIMVGGTGLYIDSVLYNYTFTDVARPELRAKLQSYSREELVEYCNNNNVELPHNTLNKRHLISAVERKNQTPSTRSKLQHAHRIIGLATTMPSLRTRIENRTKQLFSNGIVTEASKLSKLYGWDSQAMTGNIYPLIKKHLDGELTIAEVKEKNITLDYQLAKRQMTWLRRNPDIMWCNLTSAEHYIDSLFADA